MSPSATKAADKDPGLDIGKSQLMQFYKQMVAIRLFEERVNDLYTRALMPCGELDRATAGGMDNPFDFRET